MNISSSSPSSPPPMCPMFVNQTESIRYKNYSKESKKDYFPFSRFSLKMHSRNVRDLTKCEYFLMPNVNVPNDNFMKWLWSKKNNINYTMIYSDLKANYEAGLTSRPQPLNPTSRPQLLNPTRRKNPTSNRNLRWVVFWMIKIIWWRCLWI